MSGSYRSKLKSHWNWKLEVIVLAVTLMALSWILYHIGIGNKTAAIMSPLTGLLAYALIEYKSMTDITN